MPASGSFKKTTELTGCKNPGRELKKPPMQLGPKGTEAVLPKEGILASFAPLASGSSWPPLLRGSKESQRHS